LLNEGYLEEEEEEKGNKNGRLENADACGPEAAQRCNIHGRIAAIAATLDANALTTAFIKASATKAAASSVAGVIHCCLSKAASELQEEERSSRMRGTIAHS
jgi:hypothetical protein